jgi:hypothetical protein
MSDKKETAVYWLIKQMSLKDVCKYSRQLGVAKEMEKQQIIDAYWDGTEQFANDARIDYPETPEQYYSETYEQ